MTTPRQRFLDLITRAERPILLDGAMGTMLHAKGIGFDQCFDALNLENPALVAEVHRGYIEAGAQVILTNTFGANRYRLAEHGLEDKVAAINRAGVELARRVVLASFREVLVAGDVGPLGVRLAPFGRVQPEEARAAFREQMAVLAEAGADLIVIETMSDLYEVREAVLAAREVAPDLPIVTSVTFTRDDRTLLGDAPEKVAETLRDLEVDVIGVNCSGGPAQLLRILKHMRAVAPEARFWVKPNAGWPERLPGGRIMYPAGPAYFGEYALAFYQAGATLVGGCCGTTPEHIAAMHHSLEQAPPREALPRLTVSLSQRREQLPPPDEPTQLAQKLQHGQFVITVEMTPPRGLSAHKVLAGAHLLAEAGADTINVADSPMARMRMSPWAVCHLIQREVGVETVLHFPTRGRNLLRVQGDLLAAHALGVRNVFVVMGDPTAIGDYPEAMDNYDLVPSGLIKLIKQKFNAGVDHAGSDIGQPTSFFVGCALNLNPKDPEREARVLRRKIRAGADFALTQPVYDPEAARRFLDFYAERYGPVEIPILVGVLPLNNPRHAAFLHHEVPGITISEPIMRRLEQAGERAPWEGVRIALELIERIRSWAQGVYLMPQFRRYDLVAEIVEGVRARTEQG
ncbi:MAG TPA: bifunctional homocysteine S-methyltransferase/methylenetetrahydrofolate reductase [Anaerolineae bacterium]|nr:bifunctional homocysteine S-methyltransferase/methylenetetrahydrofolate reductase [Anaerolineae bacterium]HID84969.1 bifunctional homocysteine S-methyltransferase/methylenetetrahydrofolate reductase [Anaerolineales bacterium]HIQ08665.1 bifunctional homocysteine S-methyltransferase/methylenetetrahydrofolate reductase [Anaerolineaceae bacterium]